MAISPFFIAPYFFKITELQVKQY